MGIYLCDIHGSIIIEPKHVTDAIYSSGQQQKPIFSCIFGIEHCVAGIFKLGESWNKKDATTKIQNYLKKAHENWLIPFLVIENKPYVSEIRQLLSEVSYEFIDYNRLHSENIYKKEIGIVISKEQLNDIFNYIPLQLTLNEEQKKLKNIVNPHVNKIKLKIRKDLIEILTKQGG